MFFFLFVFQDFIPRVLVMYLLAVVAFIFYVSKVPERYFPGERHKILFIYLEVK